MICAQKWSRVSLLRCAGRDARRVPPRLIYDADLAHTAGRIQARDPMRPPVVRGAACGPVGALSARVGERSACHVRPGGCARPLVGARQREGRSPLIEPTSRQEKFQASLLQIMGGGASPVRGPADERAHNSHLFLRFHTLQQHVLGKGRDAAAGRAGSRRGRRGRAGRGASRGDRRAQGKARWHCSAPPAFRAAAGCLPA